MIHAWLGWCCLSTTGSDDYLSRCTAMGEALQAGRGWGGGGEMLPTQTGSREAKNRTTGFSLLILSTK